MVCSESGNAVSNTTSSVNSSNPKTSNSSHFKHIHLWSCCRTQHEGTGNEPLNDYGGISLSWNVPTSLPLPPNHSMTTSLNGTSTSTRRRAYTAGSISISFWHSPHRILWIHQKVYTLHYACSIHHHLHSVYTDPMCPAPYSVKCFASQLSIRM